MNRHPSKLTLQAYIDCELSQLSCDLIREHLDECKECSQIVHSLTIADNCFNSTQYLKASDSLKKRSLSAASEILKDRRSKIAKKNMKREKQRNLFYKLTNSIKELKEIDLLPNYLMTSLCLLLITTLGISYEEAKPSDEPIINREVNEFFVENDTEYYKEIE